MRTNMEAAPVPPERSSRSVEALRPLPRISVHGFYETESVHQTLSLAAADRRMAKVAMRMTRGTIEDAASLFSASPTPNLIVLETSSDPGTLLVRLKPLAEVCDASTRVLIIGHHNDVQLYRDLMRNGISDYIVAPVDMGDLVNTLAGIFVDPGAAPLGRTIAFIGAKGGVGASTLSHNVAWTMSNLFEAETVLADMDMPFGTANINFDQDPPQGISEAVFSPERLDEMFLDRLLTKCSEHLSLLAAPSMLDRPYDFSRTSFEPVIDLLQRNAPFVVLDVPHGWNEWTRGVLADADEIVVCATPDLASLRNTKNLFEAIRKLRPNDKIPYLILNQVNMPKRPEIAPDDFCEPLTTSPLAVISFDPALFGNAANSGRMLQEVDPKGQIVDILADVSHVLAARTPPKKARSGPFAKVLEKLGR